MSEDENKRIKAYFLQNARKVLKKADRGIEISFFGSRLGVRGGFVGLGFLFHGKGIMRCF